MPIAALTISALAARSGVAPSALRHWESVGLLGAARSPGNQRRYPRSALRRVAVIRAATGLGVPLAEIAGALAALPDGRDPTAADWARLSRRWHDALSARIDALQRLRDDLGGCIGCGCLSLTRCRLFNPGDAAAAAGPGARGLAAGRPAPPRSARRVRA